MTVSLDVNIYPLCRVNDREMGEIPGLYATLAPRWPARGRSGDTLVVHLALEGTAPITPKEYKKLVAYLADIYYKTPGSSTTAMRTVAEWLNDSLNERNLRGAHRSLQSVGLLTLAVFREDRLYLAQCGPTHTFLIDSQGLTHFYLSDLAWRGLGHGRAPNIRYHQVTLSPGDGLVISANPPLAWTTGVLNGLQGMPLVERYQSLGSQAEADCQAALIQVEAGNGNLYTLAPELLREVQDAWDMEPDLLETPAGPEELFSQDEIGPRIEKVQSAGLASQDRVGTQDEIAPQKTGLPGDILLDDSAPLSERRADGPLGEPVEAREIGDTSLDQTEADISSPEVEKASTSNQTAPPDAEMALPGGEIPSSQETTTSPGEEVASPTGESAFPPEPVISPDMLQNWFGKVPRWAWVVVCLIVLGILAGVLTRCLNSIRVVENQLDIPLVVIESGLTPSFTSEPTLARTDTPVPSPTEVSPTLPPPSATLLPTVSSTPEFEPGATQLSSRDGMLMVYIPGGEFLMGAAESDTQADSDETPQHTVHLDGFWIDQTEVTNRQYVQCAAAGVCKSPYSLTSFTRTIYFNTEAYAGYPVIFVSWYDAMAYCEWAGRRLPVEAEWEKAARGQDGRTYPWGEQTDCELANYGGCKGDTVAVGGYLDGASPFGVLDMAGNVWEWVFDWYYGGYYQDSPLDYPTGPESGAYRVIRGGSWNDDISYLRTSSRYWYFPENARVSVGFRCATSEASP
jgi:formylglycine-generating enzyme required for sulfatase activity